MRDPQSFDIWLGWVRDLGGSYTPMRDLDEKKPYTGRRDPDKKPRQYEIGTHHPDRVQYAINSNGSVIRL